MRPAMFAALLALPIPAAVAHVASFAAGGALPAAFEHANGSAVAAAANLVTLRYAGDASVYSTSGAFAVLHKSFGAGTCWGRKEYGGDCEGIVFSASTGVYSNGAAFFALNKDSGVGFCWGDKKRGGDCGGVGFSGVTDVYSTHGAFLALSRKSGTGVCWGDAELGGDCKGVDFAGTTDVYSNNVSFLALNKKSGKGACWGDRGGGGDCVGRDLSGITDVYSTSRAFFALGRSSGKVVCWGDPSSGGKCPWNHLAGTTDVRATSSTFFALNRPEGKATCWGGAGRSGNCADAPGADFFGLGYSVLGASVRLPPGTTDMYTTDGAFLMLNRASGTGVCWGADEFGGNCKGLDLSGMADVYSSRRAFVALDRKSGRAVCWGGASHGGDCSGRDFRGTTDIYTTGAAFLALNKGTGATFCWGNQEEGGRCPSDWARPARAAPAGGPAGANDSILGSGNKMTRYLFFFVVACALCICLGFEFTTAHVANAEPRNIRRLREMEIPRLRGSLRPPQPPGRRASLPSVVAEPQPAPRASATSGAMLSLARAMEGRS